MDHGQSFKIWLLSAIVKKQHADVILTPQKNIIRKKFITCSLLSQHEQHGITLILHAGDSSCMLGHTK